MPVPSLFFALSSGGVDDVIFHVSSVLEVPVLVLALAALAAAIVELGRYGVELGRRRRRRFDTLRGGAAQARGALLSNDRRAALNAVRGLGSDAEMDAALVQIVAHAREPLGEHEVNKALADFDIGAQRRLARTRVLVRIGPALGLMGTLIPLSPALTGLASGNTARLSHDLRVAFSVTVVGLLVGALAFALSLSRDRMYSQDLSDLEYLAAIVCDPGTGEPA
jgi:biopolymer transport protein ExbB/TolQ